MYHINSASKLSFLKLTIIRYLLETITSSQRRRRENWGVPRGHRAQTGYYAWQFIFERILQLHDNLIKNLL